MATHLAAFLLASHGGLPPVGEPMQVRADHVVLDESEGTVAMLAFEALGERRVTCELALVAPSHEGAGPGAREDVRYLQQAAARFGARFARPGAGGATMVHRRRFAMPGRVLASCSPASGGCGAFGMVHLHAGALECAGALAGEPLLRTRPAIVGVRVEGELPRGSAGIDALTLLSRQLGGRAAGFWLEYHGPALAALPMCDRITMAAHGQARLGAAVSLFPADDAVRAYLRARGRDTQWRRLEGGNEGFDAECVLDLSQVVPSAAGTAGEPPLRVRVGPLAEDAELRRLARALVGARVHERVSLEVVVAGRAQQAALEHDGTGQQLLAAGARLMDPSDPEGAALAGPALVCGGDPGQPGENARVVSVWACAALALRGEVGDAAALASGDPPERPESAALADGELLDVPGETSAPEHGAAHRPPGLVAAPAAIERGVLVSVLGDDASAARLLPWGPRAEALRADPRALAQLLLRDLDPGAAARLAAHGGGFLSAGERFGAGGHGEAVARALVSAGVRAVLALSYFPAMRHHLVLHGVLPLLWRDPDSRAAVLAGDELEITRLPEALTPGGRSTVRDLTRGLSFGIHQDLDPHALALARAGGLLSARARGARPLVSEGVSK